MDAESEVNSNELKTKVEANDTQTTAESIADFNDNIKTTLVYFFRQL